MQETHLKNLYKNELNPYSISDIFEYSKEIADFGEFYLGFEEKILFKDNKGKILKKKENKYPLGINNKNDDI